VKTIDFYFDFVSPYAYLAQYRLPQLAEKYGYVVNYISINLQEAKLAAGNTGPSSAQIPPKFIYSGVDLTRWAKKYGAPFVAPIPKKGDGPPKKAQIPLEMLDSSRANKGLQFAREKGMAGDYTTKVWAATFGSGGFIGNEELLRGVVANLGWDADEFIHFVDSDEAAGLYEETNKQAHARGVFGVPMMFIGEEMWWGNDRLDLMEEYMREHD